jgi:hypothetical protein
MELACDEKVIRNLEKGGVRAYSETLVSFSDRSFRVGACPLAFGEVWVKERVKAMVGYKKPGRRVLALALAMFLFLAVCFLTNPPHTTLGSVKEPQFTGLFADANSLLFRSGDYVCSVVRPADFVKALKKTPVTSNEISRSLSEDRDRTYELIDGNTILCVSADFTRIWVEDGVKPSYTYGVTDPGYLKNLLEELIPGSHPGNLQGTYVPDGCLYMSNLSSYYAWGGDSGAIYHITPSSFTEERRGGSVVACDPLPGAWEEIDWESGFFRDFETESINTPDGPRLSVFLTGEEPKYRMINDDRFLVSDEGRLLLVASYEERNGEQTIWSIYLLTGQEGKGEASWSHHPEMGMNEPWFVFEFDLAYSRVEA